MENLANFTTAYLMKSFWTATVVSAYMIGLSLDPVVGALSSS